MNIFDNLDKILISSTIISSDSYKNDIDIFDIVNSGKYDMEFSKSLIMNYIKSFETYGLSVLNKDEYKKITDIIYSKLCINSEKFLKLINREGSHIHLNCDYTTFGHPVIELYFKPSKKYSNKFDEISIIFDYFEEKIHQVVVYSLPKIENMPKTSERYVILDRKNSDKNISLNDISEMIRKRVLKSNNPYKYYKNIEKYVVVNFKSLILSNFEQNKFLIDCIQYIVPNISNYADEFRCYYGESDRRSEPSQKLTIDLAYLSKMTRYYKVETNISFHIIRIDSDYKIQIHKNFNKQSETDIPNNLSEKEFSEYVIKVIKNICDKEIKA